MFVRKLAAASLILAACAAGSVTCVAATNDTAPANSPLGPASSFVPAQHSVFNAYSAFDFALPGPLGDIAARGYSVDPLSSPLLADDFLMGGSYRYGVRDAEAVDRLMPGTELELGYNVAHVGRFSAFDGASAFDGMFLSAAAVNAPYAALTSGGNYIGSRIALSDEVSLRFGESMLDPKSSPFGIPAFSYDVPLWGSRLQLDPREARTSLVGAGWDFASWGGLDFVASQTSERNGFLGNFDSNALAMTTAANTAAVGVAAHVGFGDGWVTTVSYNQGVTQLSLRPNALASTSTDTLQSRAYGFAVAKHGLFGDDDSLGFAVSRPLQVYSGSTGLAPSNGFDVSGDLIGRQFSSLSSGETDLELGYVTTFMNGALALQANAGYQMNVAGLGGANSLSVISRAKINF